MHKIIGLTGGMGCGKSTITAYLRQLQYPVVDADQVARIVVAPQSQGLAQLAKAFGTEILQPDGALNRQALGAKAFGDRGQLAILNEITHPLINEEIKRQLAELESAPVVFLDCPLLLEEGNYQTMVDEVWVVATSERVQIERIQARDGLSLGEIEARLRAQMPTKVKIKRADRVIDNSGTPEESLAQVDGYLAELEKNW